MSDGQRRSTFVRSLGHCLTLLSGDGHRFLGDDGPTSQNIYFDVCPGDGGGSCGDCSLSSRACAPRSLVNDNKWHMVTGRWDGTNGQIYVDGVQRDSKALGTLTAPTQQLIIVPVSINTVKSGLKP